MKLVWAAALGLALMGAAGAMAQTPAAQEQVAAGDDIVVTADRLDEVLRSFVGEVSAAAPTENQLARWNREVCVGVIGIRARYGQFLVDRISERAMQIGLQAGSPGCRANVVVFVTPDGNLLSRELVDQYRALVGARREDNSNTQGSDALETFAGADQPVRWWHVSNTVTRDGQVLRDVPASQSGGQLRAQTVRTTSLGFGRLERTTRQDFNRVIIVVDATRAQGRQFDALADYVAMVALAQLDPDAETAGFDTILNLFSAEPAAAPAGMTAWDLAYLGGLYEAPRTARNANQQENAIARSMREGVAPDAQTAPAAEPAPAPEQ